MREISEVEAELARCKIRIQELHEIITGDRPDKFHDSLVRGSRVSRMEDCISTLRAIDTLIDTSESSLADQLTLIQNTVRLVLDKNPDFGLFPQKVKPKVKTKV